MKWSTLRFQISNSINQSINQSENMKVYTIENTRSAKLCLRRYYDWSTHAWRTCCACVMAWPTTLDAHARERLSGTKEHVPCPRPLILIACSPRLLPSSSLHPLTTHREVCMWRAPGIVQYWWRGQEHAMTLLVYSFFSNIHISQLRGADDRPAAGQASHR